MSREVNTNTTAAASGRTPFTVTARMITVSSTPTSQADVLTCDEYGFIVVPIGGAYSWMGSPPVPTFFKAGELIQTSTPDPELIRRKVAANEAAARAAHGFGFTDTVSNSTGTHQGQDVVRRSIEEEVTAEEAAADEAADEAAWQEVVNHAEPYNFPPELQEIIRSLPIPEPRVCRLIENCVDTPEDRAIRHLRAERFDKHVREQIAAERLHRQQRQQQQQQTSREQ